MLETYECCVCAQIQGRADNDLIATLLPERGYVRRVMYEDDAFALLPSLGPLTPGHSLLCPKVHVRSFAELPSSLDDEFARVKAELRARLASIYDADVHVFEHGVAAKGTRTLCTVDHAHMHLVPLPRALGDVAADGVACGSSLRELRSQAAGREYVYYENAAGVARVLAVDAEIESQYMRKVIAHRLGRPERWDWRAEPAAGAADESYRRFAA